MKGDTREHYGTAASTSSNIEQISKEGKGHGGSDYIFPGR